MKKIEESLRKKKKWDKPIIFAIGFNSTKGGDVPGYNEDDWTAGPDSL